MKRRVIIDLPKGQSGLEVKMKNLRAGLGFNANTMPWPVMAGKMSEPKLQVNSTLRPVPREEANLEAEKGEVAALPTKSGIPDTFKIGGERHHSGGTPLNLPSDSFIFSDTAKMRIKDPAVLAQFGMPERKNGYTPADIAKKYDVNSFKKILMDPDTDKLQKQTAELMISNYNLKLAKLAIIQESMKGFPQGIPAVAMPYIEEMGIDPAQFVQMNPGGAQDEQAQTQQGEMGDVGAEARFGGYMEDGGYIDYFEPGGPVAPFSYQAPATFSAYTPLPQQIDPEIANIIAQKTKMAEDLKIGQQAIIKSTAAKEEALLNKTHDMVMREAAKDKKEKQDFEITSLKYYLNNLQKKIKNTYLVESNVKDLITPDMEMRQLYSTQANLNSIKKQREDLKREMTDVMTRINKLDKNYTYKAPKVDTGTYKNNVIDYGKPAWVDQVNQSLDPTVKDATSKKKIAENNTGEDYEQIYNY